MYAKRALIKYTENKSIIKKRKNLGTILNKNIFANILGIIYKTNFVIVTNRLTLSPWTLAAGVLFKPNFGIITFSGSQEQCCESEIPITR